MEIFSEKLFALFTFCIIYVTGMLLKTVDTDTGEAFLVEKTEFISWISTFRFKIFRSSKYVKAIRNYFSIKLVKTADISPDKNYIFAIFPHGILWWEHE